MRDDYEPINAKPAPDGGAPALNMGCGRTSAGTNPKDLLGLKKPPLNLFPPAALIHGSMAMGNGAAKYGPYNWRKNKVIASIYIAAAMRHMASWYDGEEVADDSKVHHLGHALACIAIILDAYETGNLVDDRPDAGASSHLIAKLTKV